MSKKVNFILSLIIFASCLAGCNGQEKTVTEMAKIKTSEITRIEIRDQRGRMKDPFIVEDKQKIDEFIGFLNECVVKKYSPSEPSGGWIQEAAFYKNSEEVAVITFGDFIVINKTMHYKVVNNNISTEMVTKYLQSIDPSWKADNNLND
jgi:hypothetical protein